MKTTTQTTMKTTTTTETMMSDYYDGLTRFVNDHDDFNAAGLKPLTPQQIRFILDAIERIESPPKPSKDSPIGGRDWSKSPVPNRQCVAHKKTGDRCKNAALSGAKVCKFHGGAAKHVRNAARARLANAADRMAKELLNMATDDNVSDAVKLNAIRDALDRAGLKPGVEVEITTKPIDQILDGLEGIEAAAATRFVGASRAKVIPTLIDTHPPWRSTPSRSTPKWSKSSTCTRRCAINRATPTRRHPIPTIGCETSAERREPMT
jgi:hypothetical protein